MVERIYNNCPECGFSAYPNEIIGTERKHHWPHSLECVRCGYRTETKNTLAEAKAIWNRKDEQLRRLTEALLEANDVLRSTYQIAARGGTETNWKPFISRVHDVLKKQHALLYAQPDHMPVNECRAELTPDQR